MFKLLVLSVLVAVAAAAPSGIHGYSAGYSALPLAYDLAPEYHVSHHVSHVPTAVSHQSRVDYHSKPVYTPILANVKTIIPQPAYAVHSAPYVHSAPLIHEAPLAHGWDAHAWK